MKISNIPLDKEEAAQEESLLSGVLQPHQIEIAEIREGYRLLLSVVELLKQKLPSIDSQLNTYYIDLFTLVERNKKSIEDKIYDRYDANNDRVLPQHYIHTDIFRDFYKPFATLYAAQAVVNSLKNGWDSIFERMHNSSNQINNAYDKYCADRIKRLPNQKLFNDIKNYIDDILECNGLLLDLKKGTIQYKTNPVKKVSLDNQAIEFLTLLMQNKGNIVEHTTIAKTLNLNFYHEGVNNSDAAEDTRYLKRDLHTLLRSIGMPDTEFKDLIATQKNVGYRLNCD